MKELSFERMESINGGVLAYFFICFGVLTIALSGRTAKGYLSIGCALVSMGYDWD